VEYSVFEGESSVRRLLLGFNYCDNNGDGEKECRNVRYWLEIKFGSQHCTNVSFNTMELHKITRERG